MNHFFDPAWKHIFDDLLDDLEEQKCVLFLGPEVTKVQDISLQGYLRRQLSEKHSDDIAFYYEKDGFFLFRDQIAKEDVQRGMRRLIKQLYSSEEFNEAVFRKIASIPFHLVISINPDTYLTDIALKYGVAHRSAFFHPRKNVNAEVEVPTKNQPLFYNLCGDKNHDDSFILDYDDLFRLLQATLGAPGLPERLRRSLQTAKSFLFLGFHFDKWYSQLLLRLLSGEKAIKKFALQTQLADQHTEAFLIQQFQVKFLGHEYAFFDALHQHCAEQNLLRPLNEPLQQEQQQIVRHIQNGEMKEALSALVQTFPEQSDAHHQALLLAGRFTNLENQNTKGILEFREYNIEFNRIIDAVLVLNKSMAPL